MSMKNMKMNFFQLVEQHHFWDSLLISIYWLDTHNLKNGKEHATKRWKRRFQFQYEFSFFKTSLTYPLLCVHRKLPGPQCNSEESRKWLVLVQHILMLALILLCHDILKSKSSTYLEHIHTLRVHYAHTVANLNSGYSKYAKVLRMYYFFTVALRTPYALVSVGRMMHSRVYRIDSFTFRVILFCWLYLKNF